MSDKEKTAAKKHQSEYERHGCANKGRMSPTYRSWRAMRKRCFSKPGSHHGKRYAERGIVICPEWDSYTTFLHDMGERPDGCTLERIDNNRGYSKENCRWATKAEQSRNRTSSIMVDVDGVSMCLKDAAKQAGIKYGTVYFRIRAGWSVKDALSKTAAIGANQFSCRVNVQ